jgi:alpha-L-rhamnosidase
VLGLKKVDPVNRTVLLRLSDTGIEWCEGSLPTPDGELIAGWWKRDGGIVYRAQVPAGWKLSVENNTGLSIRAL